VEQQSLARDRHARSLLSRVAENIGNESAPIQLTQCRFPALAISNAKISIYIFRIEHTEAILANSTRKLLWFEITTLLMAFKKKITVSFIINVGILSFPIGLGSVVSLQHYITISAQ